MTDEQWRFAVRLAIQSERWFPTVYTLLDYASDAPKPETKALDSGPELGDRETFRRGFEEVFKPALKAHGIDVEEAVKDMPK